MRQNVLDKVLQEGLRLLPRHRQLEMIETSRVIRKTSVHQLDHFLCHRIGPKRFRLRQLARSGFAETLTVVMIEIPLTSFRLITIHQHIVLLSHIAVEKLEQQAFATVRILCKLLDRTVEVAIGSDVQRDAKLIRNSLKLRSYTPVAGLNHDQSFGFQAFDIKPQDLTKRLPAILRPLPVKLVIFDRAFCHRQFVSEMAHCRQKHRDS